MAELTDAQKVMRNDTGKRMADALEALAGTGGRGLPAGGTDGDVLVKNGATDYDATWKKTPPQMGSLATIELSSWAANPNGYKEGEYLVYNGQLYKVTRPISQWETLTPGWNIEAATVGSALTSAIDVRQIQFELPNSVTATKGSNTVILSNFDIKTITSSDLEYPPQNKTLIGASPLWMNSFTSAGAIMDCAVINGLLSVSVGITNANSATFTKIRILTFWR